MDFDAQGNIFVADTAFGGAQFDPKWDGAGGLWMIKHDSIDELADGKLPAVLPEFLGIPGILMVSRSPH